MHRLIVTSATLPAVVPARPELQERDPYNRLLARQTRLRLDAEIIRDSALSSSGLLDSRVGGPSVFPPQPDGVFRFTQIPRVWSTSTGADRYRRGTVHLFLPVGAPSGPDRLRRARRQWRPAPAASAPTRRCRR